MANPTMVSGATTKTFKPGNIQATRLPDTPRQTMQVSSSGKVRVLELSTTDDRFINIEVVALPRADIGGFSGYSSLRTFLTETVNGAQQIFTFTDTDGDAFSVRYWSPTFDLFEHRKDEYSGELLFRVEV